MRCFYVVDIQDDFVLYQGTLEDCEHVQDTHYAGLAVVGYRDLTPGMIESLKSLQASQHKD